MKLDLNLLPRKEKSAVLGYIVPALFVLLIAGAALYAGITIPNNHLAALAQEKNQILNDRALYAGVTETYEVQNTELQDLINKKAAIDQTFDTSRAPLKLFAAIEGSCPVTVRLTSVSFSEIGIVLQGTAPYDKDIAQFVVNLRESGLFSQTNISYVSPEAFTELPLREDEIQARVFSLILNYPVVEAVNEEGETQP